MTMSAVSSPRNLLMVNYKQGISKFQKRYKSRYVKLYSLMKVTFLLLLIEKVYALNCFVGEQEI